MQFDNHDERIRYYELILERDLEEPPAVSIAGRVSLCVF